MTGDQTHNLGISWWCSKQLTYPARADMHFSYLQTNVQWFHKILVDSSYHSLWNAAKKKTKIHSQYQETEPPLHQRRSSWGLCHLLLSHAGAVHSRHLPPVFKTIAEDQTHTPEWEQGLKVITVAFLLPCISWFMQKEPLNELQFDATMQTHAFILRSLWDSVIR